MISQLLPYPTWVPPFYFDFLGSVLDGSRNLAGSLWFFGELACHSLIFQWLPLLSSLRSYPGCRRLPFHIHSSSLSLSLSFSIWIPTYAARIIPTMWQQPSPNRRFLSYHGQAPGSNSLKISFFREKGKEDEIKRKGTRNRGRRTQRVLILPESVEKGRTDGVKGMRSVVVTT